uniref:Retrotransposon gag domain-containing protein n=1 Tax=Ananas comosus var. bracteatus TaxID=296719 RepID=A0A6V7Q971_ANACO|nr:unnamed protein product [Ananas comosus var. bracteatus]
MGRSRAPVAETSTVAQPSTAQLAALADNEGQGESDRHKSNRERLVDLEAQLTRLDEKVTKASTHEQRIAMLEATLTQLVESVTELQDNTKEAVHHLKEQTIELFARVGLLTRAMGNAPPAPQGGGHAGRVRVPEPRSFRGARDAKELENFLFDMEQYFRVVQPDNEESKVTFATMYLDGDAKLWWRTRYEDIQEGRCTIDTWEDLKKELKAQFLPENVEFIARRNLRRLQQTGSIREYVKQFSALMLDIRDMSEKDKLFHFLEGLKPWAQAELRRQNIKDLAAAQGAAERLTDYSPPEHPKKKPVSNNPKTHNQKAKGKGPASTERKGVGSKSPKNFKSPEEGCFLCGGPHFVRACPQRKSLNAVQTKEPESDEEEEAAETGSIRMGALRLLNALKGQVGRRRRPRYRRRVNIVS